MSDKIVVYSNDLNQISLGSLKEQEQNLFFSILVKLKDKGHEPVIFDTTELNNMLSKHYTESQLTAFVKGLKDHFFKLDFRTEYYYKNGGVAEESVNLFKRMRIEYTDENKKTVKSLLIEVNEQFEYMLNALKANFTAFELANFLILNSKYSKTLFRLLKQYRTQGWWQVELKEFKRLLQVPKTYQMTHIDNKIIKPSIKELTWDNGQTDMLTDYRGAERPCFKNLSVEKIKGKGRGRGGAVVALKFTWEPELVEKKQIEQSQEEPQTQSPQVEPQQPQFEIPQEEKDLMELSAGQFAATFYTAMKDTKKDKSVLVRALGRRTDKDEIGRLVEEMSRAERNARLNKELNNIE